MRERLATYARRLGRLLPELLLIVGYLGIGYWLTLYDGRLAVGWIAAVPFLVGLALEIDAYRRARR